MPVDPRALADACGGVPIGAIERMVLPPLRLRDRRECRGCRDRATRAGREDRGGRGGGAARGRVVERGVDGGDAPGADPVDERARGRRQPPGGVGPRRRPVRLRRLVHDRVRPRRWNPRRPCCGRPAPPRSCRSPGWRPSRATRTIPRPSRTCCSNGRHRCSSGSSRRRPGTWNSVSGTCGSGRRSRRPGTTSHFATGSCSWTVATSRDRIS